MVSVHLRMKLGDWKMRNYDNPSARTHNFQFYLFVVGEETAACYVYAMPLSMCCYVAVVLIEMCSFNLLDSSLPISSLIRIR